MFRKIGHRYIAFDAANEGGTGGGGDAHPVAPWGASSLGFAYPLASTC